MTTIPVTMLDGAIQRVPGRMPREDEYVALLFGDPIPDIEPPRGAELSCGPGGWSIRRKQPSLTLYQSHQMPAHWIIRARRSGRSDTWWLIPATPTGWQDRREMASAPDERRLEEMGPHWLRAADIGIPADVCDAAMI